MQEPENELDRVRASIERLMVAKDIKRKPLAKKSGLGDTSIRDLLDNPERDIKLGTLHKVAGGLEVSIEELVNSGALRVVGSIGAGGSIIYEEAIGATVPRPPGVAGPVEPLEVRGDSMLPRYSSGDVIYISKEHDGVEEADIGAYCVVRLSSGETYVKILARGSKPGLFTLRSLNAADIEDVELDWATPVLFVISAHARRRMGF
jgi:phage repressor protein C with HTH and peptisase S24 domain